MLAKKKQFAVQSGIMDNLAPQALYFYKNQVSMGDREGRIIVVTGYPSSVNPAWLKNISNIPGVVMSVHITPAGDKGKLIKMIDRSTGELESRLESVKSNLVRQRTEKSIEDARSLMDKLDNENEQIYYVTIVLLVLADNYEELKTKTNQVQGELGVKGMSGRVVTFKQEQGFKSVGPWGKCSEEIYQTGARNMPSETVAASFPFAASSINDGTGIAMGKDKDGGMILLNIWLRGSDRNNSNWTITGMPGSGKSFAAKLMMLREYMQGTKFITLDPEREYRQLCKKIGGSWINCAGGGRINPLQVNPLPLDPDFDDDEDDPDMIELAQARSQGPLALHLQFLKTFFRIYFPELNDTERVALQKTIRQVYSDFNITWDTDPATIKVDEWPTLSTVRDYVEEKANEDPESYKRTYLFLDEACEGADSAFFDGHTTINTDSDFVVLDIHDLQNADENVRRAQYFNILNYTWHKIEQDRNQKTVLVVDEAWLLVDPENPKTLAFMREASKRVRKYMGALWVITQNVIDFTHESVEKHGQALINNPAYKLLMMQGDKDLEALNKLMSLSEYEQEKLTKFYRGDGLLVGGSKRILANIEAAPFEMEYLTGGGK